VWENEIIHPVRGWPDYYAQALAQANPWGKPPLWLLQHGCPDSECGAWGRDEILGRTKAAPYWLRLWKSFDDTLKLPGDFERGWITSVRDTLGAAVAQVQAEERRESAERAATSQAYFDRLFQDSIDHAPAPYMETEAEQNYTSLQGAEELFERQFEADQNAANGNPVTGPATVQLANAFFAAEDTAGDFIKFVLLIAGVVLGYRLLRKLL